MTLRTETTVLAGLPISVAFEISPAQPSVGLMSPDVADWWIEAIGGRKAKRPPRWLYRRISATRGEEERLMEALLDEYYESEREYGE